MNKKIVSLALSAALIFSALSVPAFAAEGDAEPKTLPEASASTETVSEEENAEGDLVIVLPSASESAASSEAPAASSEAAAPAAEPAAESKTAAESAEPADTKNSFTYVALGDSICSGVGLVNVQYGTSLMDLDVAYNFEGYPDQCYVAQVGKTFDLDRQHAINLGLPALMSSDLVEMVRDGKMSSMNMLSGCEYNYPQFRDYISKADVISIQIGSNDALVPCIVALGNATNWKSEDLASVVLSGNLRKLDSETFNALSKSLKKFQLTNEEINATWKLLTTGMNDICKEAYPNASSNLRTVVEEIRKINPDAQIILLGYTNPVPLLSCWSSYFNKMNKYEKELASVYDLTYVGIPWTQTVVDGHPTPAGHKYIARQISKAIKTYQKSHT